METRERRSTAARIGVTVLNLMMPGLGLVRLGSGRDGLLLLVAPPLVIAISIALVAVMPTATFAGAVMFAAALIALLLGIYIFSLMLTWKRSIGPILGRRWWSRWYGLLIMWLVASLATSLAVDGFHRFYKPFYTPAESMAPTLGKFDKFIGDMRYRRPAVGDVVLFDTPNGIYVKRVVALEGSRVAMKGGVPIIDGHPAAQHREGMTSFLGWEGRVPARLLRERLPGETNSHFILDVESSFLDDSAEQIVPPGSIFVLGDNRDRSADSRVPIEEGGAGMVAVDSIVARPLFIHWSQDRAKIGQSIAR